jgi:hypothetical protein
VDPRAGLDDVEKRKFLPLPGLELRPLGRPARSQSRYRLSYSGSPGYILKRNIPYLKSTLREHATYSFTSKLELVLDASGFLHSAEVPPTAGGYSFAATLARERQSHVFMRN